jgi:hypothetical protein
MALTNMGSLIQPAEDKNWVLYHALPGLGLLLSNITLQVSSWPRDQW